MKMVSITSGIVHFYIPLFVHLNSIIYISVDYIIQSFSVSEDAASKRMRTLANTTYEWKSRAEREYDDIIVLKYASMINKIAPKNFYEYDFDDEYDRQRERDSWYADSRTRW